MCKNAALCVALLLGAVGSPAMAQDKLRILGIAGADGVVVMLRNAAGCGADQVLRSTGETTLGNLRPPGANCSAELAIFSRGNAMFFESPVTAWTNHAGDVHTVTLQPLIAVPVSIWVKDDAARARASADLEKADDLYRRNRVGARLVGSIKKIADVSNDPGAFRIVSEGIREVRDEHGTLRALECRNLGAIQGREFHTGKRALNVYYVDGGFTGRNCAILATPSSCTNDATAFPGGDGNITFVGRNATSTTLAHELGHAFGLRPSGCGAHTNDLPGFGADNIMAAAGGDERATFSLGQVFRMNTQKDPWGGSMLIKNRLRPGPERECMGQTARTNRCPALAEKFPD